MTFPWDMHPDLTSERLISVAQLILRGRDNAVDRHDTTIGDDDWILGCSAFQCCRWLILNAADGDDFDWLTIVDSSKHLIFKIGAVPVRFYRGEPEETSHRTKAQSFPELLQLSLAFPDDDVSDVVYRIAVQTDLEGRALSVHCVGHKGENVVMNWAIPFEIAGHNLSAISDSDVGVDLPPPLVEEKNGHLGVNDNSSTANEKGNAV